MFAIMIQNLMRILNTGSVQIATGIRNQNQVRYNKPQLRQLSRKRGVRGVKTYLLLEMTRVYSFRYHRSYLHENLCKETLRHRL